MAEYASFKHTNSGGDIDTTRSVYYYTNTADTQEANIKYKL